MNQKIDDYYQSSNNVDYSYSATGISKLPPLYPRLNNNDTRFDRLKPEASISILSRGSLPPVRSDSTENVKLDRSEFFIILNLLKKDIRRLFCYQILS